MLEYLAPGFIYSLLKDGRAGFRGRKRRLSPSERIAIRHKWKAEFDEKLAVRRRDKLGMDVIVRDVKRVDSYPDTKEGKGISSWYRCGLMGTYHRGVQLGLSWESLNCDGAKGWRYTNHKAGEKDGTKAILIGFVPYENIESVDWDGDEFYNKPHLYCHFDAGRGEPYENLAFCEKQELNGYDYYTEIADFEPVRKLSKKLGIR